MATTRPRLQEDALYLAFDRYVCFSPMCAGAHALATGKTLRGRKLIPLGGTRLTQALAEEKAYGGDFLSCECGAVTKNA